jgi:hypothetical protein
VKAAPHTKIDGTQTRPVLDLDSMLRRAIEPSTPPWSRQAWESFLANLNLPQRRRELREALGMDAEDDE